MPGFKKNGNGIDNFFKTRPSKNNIREGETVSFLENGNLVKQEKRKQIEEILKKGKLAHLVLRFKRLKP